MSALRLMFDTNILSDMMRTPSGRCRTRLFALVTDTPEVQVCTSVVVDCEVHFGLERKASARLAQSYAELLQVIDVLPLDAAVVPHYARIRTQLERLGTPIGPNDTLIAAHALALDCTLITDNDAEFARVPGLRVENWLR